MNKVELILKEVERYKKVIGDPLLSDDDLIIGERIACNYIIKLIKSLPKEPSKVWHDANEEPKEGSSIVAVTTQREFLQDDNFSSDNYIPNWEGFVKKDNIECWAYKCDLLDIQEEPVSEDLKEAADNCYFRNHAYARESFIEGAKWKEQQMMEKAVEWLEKNADNYTWYDEECADSGLTDDFIEDFRKAVSDNH